MEMEIRILRLLTRERRDRSLSIWATETEHSTMELILLEEKQDKTPPVVQWLLRTSMEMGSWTLPPAKSLPTQSLSFSEMGMELSKPNSATPSLMGPTI